MNLEYSLRPQQVIIDNLRPNDANPYRRIIRRVSWLPPESFPYLFHTSSKELGEVDPAFCQSFDYKLFGQVLPVTYVLPFPHVNRARQASEIWGVNRKEGYEMSGLPYTYLNIPHNGRDYARIRLGSTMLDQYLLAARNNGMVFEVFLTELNKEGRLSSMKEVIALEKLPVVDAHQFRDPSPVGFGGGGFETHLPHDIYNPSATGFLTFTQYIDGLSRSSQRTELIDLANEMVSVKPQQIIHRVLGGIVEENRQAFMRVARSGNRVLLNLSR